MYKGILKLQLMFFVPILFSFRYKRYSVTRYGHQCDMSRVTFVTISSPLENIFHYKLFFLKEKSLIHTNMKILHKSIYFLLLCS